MTFRPRIRTIKPEMWADEKVGQLSRDARLLFVGLITMADDEGRLRGMPAGILGHVFPYDVDALRKLDGWLRELVQSGLVQTYEHGGIRYFYLPGFVKHQVINKAKASTLPVAGQSAARIETVVVPDSDGTNPVAVRASRARGGSGTERNGTDSPQPPADAGGARGSGSSAPPQINPRALGTNPRANARRLAAVEAANRSSLALAALTTPNDEHRAGWERLHTALIGAVSGIAEAYVTDLCLAAVEGDTLVIGGTEPAWLWASQRFGRGLAACSEGLGVPARFASQDEFSGLGGTDKGEEAA